MVEYIIGNNLDNFLDGSVEDEIYLGFGGDDTLNNLGGTDVFVGGAGSDTLITDVSHLPPEDSVAKLDLTAGTHGRADSSVGQDQVIGVENFTFIGDWDTIIIGDAAENTFISDSGSDDVSGGGGNDTIRTGAGEDTLNGGAGDDELEGGADADTFIFEKGGDNDTITDFTSGEDQILLGGFSGLEVYFAFTSGTSQQGNDLVINFGGGDTITLQDTMWWEISAGDFELLV